MKDREVLNTDMSGEQIVNDPVQDSGGNASQDDSE